MCSIGIFATELEAVTSAPLRQAAVMNNVEDFRQVFEKAFENLVIDRMEGNESIFNRLMTDSEFRGVASEHLLCIRFMKVSVNGILKISKLLTVKTAVSTTLIE